MIKTKLILFGVVLLSLFYLTVLYFALNPNVSVAYSEYYIHNSTMFYNQKVPDMLLPLGKSLSVKMLMPYFSREGWSKQSIKDENALLLNKGSLIFNLNSTSKVEIFNFQFSQVNHPITVFFTIAGQRFIKLLMPSDVGLISLNVPNALLSHRFDKVNTLTLCSSSPVSLMNLMVKEL
ncbi:hypothetical protein [uncultured Shewanella sp.]|uniref:hypothetical protein n=1 Tax=uncultured Shewanella sp. TaxID=173975 RepID=UPI0026336B22|nr:hypothetical protein [uncultured Shewanella sp.]